LKFINSPTEKTTAATDLLLALVAAAAICYLQRLESPEVWKINTWSWAFAFIGLSGILGAIAHGLELTEFKHRQLAVSIFVIGVIYDLWGLAISRRMLPWMMMIAVGFYIITRLYTGIFFVFIVYEALVLLFALVAYSWLALKGQLNGSVIMALGILISILAAGIQANKNVSVKLFVEFDHNGIFHIVQIIGMLFLVTGLRMSL
jgi:hypothetical protein